MQKGATVWFTGLSGAGKPTICHEVAAQLSVMGIRAELLDGDEVRKHISKDLGFNREDRIRNIQRMAFICKILTRNRILVLASFLSPYQEMRDYCRNEIDSFIEVYVKCPLEECIRRDVKGLYSKALSGEIKQFTGISDPYEVPSHLTLLRNPLERVISDYYYSLAYHKLSFESYLKLGYDYKDYNPNEMQVRYATGNNSLNLELAIKNLETYFPVVGITERFSESVFMMKQQFGWKDIYYQIANVNKKRPVLQESASIIQEIKEKNRLDIQLYNWALDRLNQQIDLLNTTSKKDLNSFILNQSIFSPPPATM